MITHKANNDHFLGADVSKDSITFFCPQEKQVHTVSNTKKALKPFLSKQESQTVVLEATGGYEAKAIEVALELKMDIYRVNPFRVRAFMKASGQFAKTDALDAQALSAFAQQHHATLRKYVPPTQNQKKLLQLNRRRDELLHMRTQENNRLKAPDNKSVARGIEQHLKFLQKQISDVEDQINLLVEQDEKMRTKRVILTQEKGIANTIANNLIASIPELGSVNRKQIASLAGLAPFAKDSGAYSGYRRTGKGRQNVRQLLFMAALTASRYNPKLKHFYDRLINNGKKPMVALTAVARKLLVILNAKLRDAAIHSLDRPDLKQG